jgi:hypothetical protein
MTSFIDDLRRVELKYFDKVENAEGRKIWVAKTVAARIHAPNMSVSDQGFRQLFKVCLLFTAPPYIHDNHPAENSISHIDIIKRLKYNYIIIEKKMNQLTQYIIVLLLLLLLSYYYDKEVIMCMCVTCACVLC